MLFNNFENMLSENSEIMSNIPEVEATNEGYELADMGEILAEGEMNIHKINMGVLDVQTYSSVKLMSEAKNGNLNESALNEAQMLQEKVLGSVFANLKKILATLLAKVKEVIKNLTMQFNKVFNQSAWLSEAKDKLKNVTDFGGATIKGYTFTVDALDPEAVFNSVKKVVDSEYNTLMGSIKDGATADDARKVNEKAINGLDQFKSADFQDKMSQAAGAENVSDLGKHFFKVARNNSDEQTEIKITSASEAIKILEGLKSAKGKLASVDARLSKAYSTAITEINKQEKEYNKMVGENVKGAKIVSELKKQLTSTQANLVGKAFSVASQASQAKLTAIKAEASQAKSLVSKALVGVKDAKKKENDTKLKVNESGIEKFFIPQIL